MGLSFSESVITIIFPLVAFTVVEQTGCSALLHIAAFRNGGRHRLPLPYRYGAYMLMQPLAGVDAVGPDLDRAFIDLFNIEERQQRHWPHPRVNS